MSKEAEYLKHKKESILNIIKKHDEWAVSLYPRDCDTMDISRDFCGEKNFCAKCGQCCNTMPCTYSPYDFLDIEDIDYMRRILETGVVTLVNYNNYFPYVIRNRGILDDETVAGRDNDSLTNKCILLGKNGCMLPDVYRASEGLLLVKHYSYHDILYKDKNFREDYAQYNYYLSTLYEEYKDLTIPKKDIDEKSIEEFIKCLINK